MKLKIILLIFTNLLFYNYTLAYQIETHSYLTKEIIDFYNQNFKNKIPDNLENYLIDGSRKEDEPPRWMNHFYDPVYNRGLSEDAAIDPAYRLGNWQSSKYWANDSKNQNNFLYKTAATIFSILSSIEQKKLGLITTESDFSWERALKLYIQGEKEKAFYVLGHILHLIEDTSVPDHTRNDPHPEDSPYEKYTSKYNLNNFDQELKIRLKNKKPIILDNLNSYFDNLANYSNNNFYSKDTIGIQSGYEKPYSFDRRLYKELWFRFNEDYEFGDYPLIHEIKPQNFNYITNNKFNLTLIDPNNFVLSSYWERLSTKAVQNGAGVINLFFEEVEKNKNNPKYLEKELSFWDKIKNTTKNTTSNIINSLQTFGSQTIQTLNEFINYILNKNNNQNNIYQIPINNQDSNNQNIAQNSDNQISQSQKSNLDSENKQKNNFQNNQDDLEPEEPFILENNQNNQTSTNQITDEEDEKEKINNLIQNYKQCSFQTNQAPSHQGVIINEIAWMGTPESSNNEWIELKNISNQEIDLNNWQLIDKAEQIKINFSFLVNTKIKPGQFLILERTSDNTLPNLKADLIYVGALSNSEEGLRLFDKNCNLIDEVLANPSWPAGDSKTRKTAERKNDLTWQTSFNSSGTPKNENSTGSSNSGGGGRGTSNLINQTEQPKQTTTQNILISEIQISPSDQRFIELYNPNNFDIDLTGYYLQRKTSTGSSWNSLVSKTNFESKKIKAKSFFLISRFASNKSDIILENLTLTNSNSIQLKDNNGNVIDLIGWGDTLNCNGSCAPNPQINQSIERIFNNNQIQNTNNNLSDFQISNCPSPGDYQNANCNSAEASLNDAFLKYTNTNHLLISEILFNPEQEDDGKEFIEFYNPTNQEIDLTGWSIKIIKNNSTSTENLLTFNSSDFSKIKPQSFLLLGFSNYYNLETPADATRSINLPNDFESIILFDKNKNEIDRFDYKEYKNQNGAITEGFSIERKAYNTNCILPIADGEFFGNGCDTDQIDDFTIRSSPKPQNSLNLPEPRKAPEIKNLDINFDAQNTEIKILWDESFDSQNNTSTLTYKILDKNSSSSTTIFEKQGKDINFSSSSFNYSFKIYELNKEYNYEFQIIDKDNLSTTSSLKILAESFIENGYFFKDPLSGKYYFTLKFNPNHKFFDKFDTSETSPLGYQGIIFFLNQDPQIKDSLSMKEGMNIPNSNQIKIHYPTCGYSGNNILIFPQNKRSCLPYGYHLGTWAYQFNSLEDDVLTIELDINNENLNNNDYLTISFYGELYSNLDFDYFLKFLALDSKKYYLLNDNSFLNPPTPPQNIQLNFDEANQKLNISANQSTDLDSLDSNIYYEYSYSTSTELGQNNWIKTPTPTIPNFSINIEYGKNYIIGLKAIDEFGKISEPTIANWSFPENFVILAEQTKQEESEYAFIQSNAQSLAQIFSPKESGYAKNIKLYITSYIIQNWMRGRSEAQVILYNFNFDDVNIENFKNSLNDENKIAGSEPINNNFINGGFISFNFPTKPYLEKDKKYIWLINLGSYGHLGGECSSSSPTEYSFASYPGSGWSDEYCRLVMKNYYFVINGEK